MAASSIVEQSTLSNYLLATVQHHAISYAVDFEARVLRGTVDYTVLIRGPARELVLDTNHLVIHSARVDGAESPFLLRPDVEPFGRALCVPISGEPGSTVVVSVAFETTSESAALQFLAKEMTADKVSPFLFTQCQAIHARLLLPCQDAPGVKSTFTADVTVPTACTAVMGAVSTGAPTPSADGATTTYHFAQRVPIPSYLIALAVGRLESRRVGPRSLVYAEPSVVDAAAWEFAETEAFVAAGETLLGPYVWGEYNVLVLPPSFPYGGMENPCLTFVTPTLLCGDRSLTDVLAHEITHSWMGNLVTNATANAFWLNEGHTMMIQRKILGLLHGDAAFHFDAFSGEMALTETIHKFMDRGETEFTKLVPDLAGIDPGEALLPFPSLSHASMPA